MNEVILQAGEIIERALAEDIGWGDVTTNALISPEQEGTTYLVARKNGILAGIGVALAVFRRVDSCLSTEELMADGMRVSPGDRLASVEGRLSGMLSAERVALNFVQHMSGIATLTNAFVEAVSGTGASIVDTRKTLPGLRILEKYAVRVGGGYGHREGLADGVLIKDNHLAALRQRGMSLEEAIREARANAPHTLRIEIEVESIEQALRAINAGADIILLDNMGLEEMRSVVNATKGQVVIEASGGISLETVREVAQTGVDLISVGALTHSAPALDIGLDFASG